MGREENFKKLYTDEENLFIEMNATKPIEWIAKRLKRPVHGIRIQMIHLGVSNLHEEAQTYSAKGLAELIGVSREAVRRWIFNNGLKAVKLPRREGANERCTHHHIRVEDFWEWAEQHKHLVDFNKIEPRTLLPEPAWVAEERKKQFYQPARQKIWTPEEDEILWNLYYRDALKQQEIAERLNRTRTSVEHRLARLRRKQNAKQD